MIVCQITIRKKIWMKHRSSPSKERKLNFSFKEGIGCSSSRQRTKKQTTWDYELYMNICTQISFCWQKKKHVWYLLSFIRRALWHHHEMERMELRQCLWFVFAQMRAIHFVQILANKRRKMHYKHLEFFEIVEFIVE